MTTTPWLATSVKFMTSSEPMSTNSGMGSLGANLRDAKMSAQETTAKARAMPLACEALVKMRMVLVMTWSDGVTRSPIILGTCMYMSENATPEMKPPMTGWDT